MSNTSSLLARYEAAEPFELVRYEFFSANYEQVRRGIFRIVSHLSEIEDGVALRTASNIRSLLFSWLTEPVDFSVDARGKFAAAFPQNQNLSALFGADVARLFSLTLQGLSELALSPNPLREKLLSLVVGHLQQNKSIGIYCARSTRPMFEQLFDNAQAEYAERIKYVHTARQYSQVMSLDALIKVGPLRSQGWGACPDALITAPRQTAIINLLWSGSRDEDGFGFSPLDGWKVDSPTNESKQGISVGYLNGLSLRSSSHYVGNPSDSSIDRPDAMELDELNSLSKIVPKSTATHRQCVALWLSGSQAMMLTPEARVIVVSPSEDPRVSTVCARDCADLVGCIAVFPNVNDEELGRFSAAESELSHAWKRALRELYERDDMLLIDCLKDEGINLKSLDKVIRNWYSVDEGVIHGPQLRDHFEALLRVLGFGNKTVANKNGGPIAFWRAAWLEISKSRGMAIQNGQLASELVTEQVVSLLEQNTEVIAGVLSRDRNRIDLTQKSGLSGHLKLYEIEGAELRLIAPESELRRIISIEEVAQWRQ